MTRIRRTLLALAALTVTTGLEAQMPTSATLEELDQGVRIRAQGPAVRDLIRPSLGEVLQRGLMAMVVRPPAEGVVVDATPESLTFTVSSRSRLVEVPWSGIESVDVYMGRSPALGAAQGAGLGALSGLALWGFIELIFVRADNPVVDEPEVLIGIAALTSAAYGAVALGDRWSEAYPRPAVR